MEKKTLQKRIKKGCKKFANTEKSSTFAPALIRQRVHRNTEKRIKKFLKKSLKKIWFVRSKDSIFAVRK